MALSTLLASAVPKSATDFGNEAAELQRRQMQAEAEHALRGVQVQSAQEEMANKRRGMAISMLGGLETEADEAKRAELYATLKPLAERYDPTLKLPEAYDPGLTRSLQYATLTPQQQFDLRLKGQGDLPQGYRFNPQTGQAELIPGVDPSFGRKMDPFSVPVPVYDPATGQHTFAPRGALTTGGYQPPSAAPPKPKPMPATALKMQQEEIDAARLAGAIDADLGVFQTTIENGGLNLSLADNLESRARNFAGKSTENSRNYASFRTALEKMRNDSLRLNKGVQTEGDAVRAWNELFENVNDEKVVTQRLQEIRDINRRAALHRRMNVDAIRQNYGLDPIDDATFEASPAVLPNGKAPKGGGRIIDFNDLPE